MTITTIPALDRTSATFKTDVDTFFGTQLPAFADEANALAADVNAKQATASAAAEQAELATTNGAAQVSLAAAQVSLAAEQAELATTQAVIATDNATLTAADRVQTGLDADATAADRIATAADRVQTGVDRAATAADHAAVSEALIALSVGPVLSVNGTGGAVTLKMINNTLLTGAGDIVLIANTDYDSRSTLRSTTDPDGAYRLVESLGLFRFYTNSDEPDDDETCFATASGRWLLECPHWDVADAMRMPDESAQDDRVEDTETRLTDTETRWPGRVLYGSAACAITSVAEVTQVSFTAALAGAAVGDRVLATPPNALTGCIACCALVSATDTVTIYINNPSAAAATLVTGAWKLAVFKEI